jgi:hypothetical protein
VVLFSFYLLLFLPQKEAMLRPAARDQLLQLSNHLVAPKTPY